MDCCKNDLGEFPHNKIITLPGIVAAQAGEHVLRFNFAGNIRYLKKIVSIGNGFVIAPGEINEEALHEFKIIQPNGIPLAKDDCENFILKTYIANDGSCSPAACGDAVDPIYGYL